MSQITRVNLLKIDNNRVWLLVDPKANEAQSAVHVVDILVDQSVDSVAIISFILAASVGCARTEVE